LEPNGQITVNTVLYGGTVLYGRTPSFQTDRTCTVLYGVLRYGTVITVKKAEVRRISTSLIRLLSTTLEGIGIEVALLHVLLTDTLISTIAAHHDESTQHICLPHTASLSGCDVRVHKNLRTRACMFVSVCMCTCLCTVDRTVPLTYSACSHFTSVAWLGRARRRPATETVQLTLVQAARQALQVKIHCQTQPPGLPPATWQISYTPPSPFC